MMSDQGSLIVAGTGIRGVEQMTLETVRHVQEAEKLLLLVTAGPAERWLMGQNATAESLRPFYRVGKDRLQTYVDMAEHTVSFVRAGLRVCMIAYGHPGVYAMPTHLAMKLARQEGYRATMLPGVSADACLTADLGCDPGQGGCRTYEATDFLARRRSLDPLSQLVVWQVGIIGMLDSVSIFDARPGLQALHDRLREAYPADHPVTMYEAATEYGQESRLDRMPLADLPGARTNAKSTLYVPAVGLPDYDDDVLASLGVGPDARRRRRENEKFRHELLERMRSADEVVAPVH